MRVQYLNEIDSECYQPKHISDDFTNEEQINLCKQRTYNKIFGKYDEDYFYARESDKMRFKMCMEDQGAQWSGIQ